MSSYNSNTSLSASTRPPMSAPVAITESKQVTAKRAAVAPALGHARSAPAIQRNFANRKTPENATPLAQSAPNARVINRESSQITKVRTGKDSPLRPSEKTRIGAGRVGPGSLSTDSASRKQILKDLITDHINQSKTEATPSENGEPVPISEKKSIAASPA